MIMGQPPTASNPETASPCPLQATYEALSDTCRGVIGETATGAFRQQCAECHAFTEDLHLWQAALKDRFEHPVICTACSEYEFALLSLFHGDYRAAFARLRGFVEQTFFAVYGSAHLLAFREWLAGSRDLGWGQVMSEEQGVFSTVFCRSFFPELTDEAAHFRSLASKVYRECSEYVHGNRYIAIPPPETLGYNEPLVEAWCARANTSILVCSLAFVIRYYRELGPDHSKALEQSILDQLGTIPEVRGVVGGSVEVASG